MTDARARFRYWPPAAVAAPRTGCGGAGFTVRLAPLERGMLQRMQALEDAICFRRVCLSIPCPDCAEPGGECDEHARDSELIAEYQLAIRLLSLDLTSGQPGSR